MRVDRQGWLVGRPFAYAHWRGTPPECGQASTPVAGAPVTGRGHRPAPKLGSVPDVDTPTSGMTGPINARVESAPSVRRGGDLVEEMEQGRLAVDRLELLEQELRPSGDAGAETPGGDDHPHSGGGHRRAVMS